MSASVKHRLFRYLFFVVCVIVPLLRTRCVLNLSLSLFFFILLTAACRAVIDSLLAVPLPSFYILLFCYSPVRSSGVQLGMILPVLLASAYELPAENDSFKYSGMCW